MKKELQQLSDAQLVLAYLNGNSLAWDVLFKRHNPKMLRYIASIAGADLAPDVMQETWIVVITAILKASYKEDQCFSKWIKGIAYRQAVKAYHDVHWSENSGEPVPDSPDSTMNVEERMINKECETLLHQSLNELGARERQVVILHSFQQMSFSEICLFMNIERSNTVSKIYFRALKKMRQFIHNS